MTPTLFDKYRPDEPNTKPKPERRCKECGKWTKTKHNHKETK